MKTYTVFGINLETHETTHNLIVESSAKAAQESLEEIHGTDWDTVAVIEGFHINRKGQPA